MSIRIGPESPKQEMFLTTEADITVFGGGAASGKTYMGVMDYLSYVDDPYFTGVITRRTTPQLMGPGGPYEKCLDMFRTMYPKVKWQDKKSKFVFPSGAQVFLRHFEHEKSKEDFTGWELTKVLIDEGQQYTEDMVIFLMSRLRNPKCKYKPKMKITCNPDKNSYLRTWLNWYIDEQGFPIQEKSGVLRWFVRHEGKMQWADSRSECIKQFGKSWLEEDHKDQIKPLSFTFIPANVYDNPIVMKIQPEYVGWLEGLGRVEKDRLLYGNWDAIEQASGYFKREWLGDPLPFRPPKDVVKRIRAWDFAGAVKSELNPNPDWTAGVLMAKLKDGRVVIEDVVRFRARHGEVLERVMKVAVEDGDNVQIIIPREPGQAGMHAASYFIRELSEHGFYARAFPTNQSKLTRFAPFAATAEAGNVSYVVGEWNEEYLKELEGFDGSRKNKDDKQINLSSINSIN